MTRPEDQRNSDEDPQTIADTRVPFAVAGMASSAGGLNALGAVLADLPATFPIPVLVVQHLDPRHRSLIAEILGRQAPLAVRQATDGETILPGTVFIAPPDRHLLISPDGRMSLSDSELVHFVRPSADLLFESLAGSFGEQTIALVLSGTGVDGAMGVAAIKKVGGTVIVQDPSTAEFPGMPQAAVDAGPVDFILPLDEIGAALNLLVLGENVE